LSTEEVVERRERPTMKDVAALAGVSAKTVSRVMHDVPSVAPDIAERVRAATQKLGYRPNLTASNLRRGDRRTHMIGLLLENVSNPYSAAVHRAVEDYCRNHRMLVLAGSLDEDADRERALAHTLIERRVDGLIIMSAAQDHRWVVPEQLVGTSFVFIDREPSPLVADAVVTDNRSAAAEAVRHLLATGRRLAYFGDDLSIATARERFRGFQDAMKAAGLAVDDRFVRHGLRTVEHAQLAALDMLATAPPEAMFASQNLVTLGVLEVLHKSDRQHDIALVGFDDIPLGDILRPGVTVMAQDPAAIGRQAAELLLDRINGDTSPPQLYTIPSRLVVRGSGELPRRP
jgi:LacI family transcriptional regulator